MVALVTFGIGTAASLLFPSFGHMKGCGRSVVTTKTEVGQLSVAHELEASIRGGELNGKAIMLPKATYPAIAREAHASGKVTVEVVIDESGKVTWARATGGHPLLQQAAVQAAYGARFVPARLDGKPVKVTGDIVYNFVSQ